MIDQKQLTLKIETYSYPERIKYRRRDPEAFREYLKAHSGPKSWVWLSDFCRRWAFQRRRGKGLSRLWKIPGPVRIEAKALGFLVRSQKWRVLEDGVIKRDLRIWFELIK